MKGKGGEEREGFGTARTMTDIFTIIVNESLFTFIAKTIKIVKCHYNYLFPHCVNSKIKKWVKFTQCAQIILLTRHRANSFTPLS